MARQLMQLVVGVVLAIAGYQMGDVFGLFLMGIGVLLALFAVAGFVTNRMHPVVGGAPGTAQYHNPLGPQQPDLGSSGIDTGSSS